MRDKRPALSLLAKDSAEKETLSPNEAAEYVGVTGEAIKQLIRRGQLPAIKLPNGYWRIRSSDLERFLDQRTGTLRGKVMLCGIDGQAQEVLAPELSRECLTMLKPYNAPDALLKIGRECPALLFVDGEQWSDLWTFLRSVRDLRIGSSLPIVVLGKGDLPHPELYHAFDLKIDGYLKKPLRTSAFRTEMAYWIRPQKT